ncbi:uncharacterized protein LOC135477846 [Liolophura sinensis]|uniref:uncharacterized protein LOC135477846 n=1 Tax=Liolophura sinensis TaxID=3198878 RepID=UPI003158DB08
MAEVITTVFEMRTLLTRTITRAKNGNSNRSTWKRAWIYFLKTTTIHGIRYVWKAHAFRIQRLVWLGLVLGGITVMSYQIIDRIIHYYKWPTTVNVAVNFNNSLRFPAITLCNQNTFRATAAVADGRYHFIKELFGGNRNLTDFHMNNNITLNITVENLYSRAAHRKEDMIVSCHLGTTPCSVENFTQILTDHGVCYTFNGQVSKGNKPRKIIFTGIKQGLHLVLNVEQYDNMVGHHGTAGVKVLVHDQNEFPLVDDLGLAVPTGSHSFLSNTLFVVENLPHPHGKCDVKTLPYFPDVPYTKTRCKIDCLTRELAKRCGCRDAYLPSANESFHLKENDLCSCPVQCNFARYKSAISYATMSTSNTDKLRMSLDSGLFRQKYLDAREITNRYVSSNFRNFKAIIEEFTTAFVRLHELLEKKLRTKLQMLKEVLSKKEQVVNQIWKKKNFIQRFQYHMIRKNFLEGRRAMQERTLGYIGNGFQAFTLEICRNLQALVHNTEMKNDRRDALYRLLMDKLNIEIEMINRGIGNLTQIIEAYREGIPIFGYVFARVPVSHNAHVVPKKLLNESLYRTENSREYGLGIVDDLKLLNLKLMEFKNISQQAYFQKRLDMDNIEDVNNLILKYYRLFFQNKASLYFESLEWPELVMKIRIRNFTRLWINFTILTDSIRRNVDLITTSLKDVRNNVLPELRSIVTLCRAYLVNDTVQKTQLAQAVLKPDIAEKINAMKVLFEEVRIRAHAIFDDWETLVETTNEVWWEILTDEDSLEYYAWAGHENFLQNLSTVQSKEWQDFQALRNDTDILHLIGNKDSDFYFFMDMLTSNMEMFQNSIRLDNNFVRENFILLDVFYSQLSYEQVTQQEAYPIFSLLCDIGGSLGLFLGASALSIFEVVDLIVSHLYHLILGTRRS